MHVRIICFPLTFPDCVQTKVLQLIKHTFSIYFWNDFTLYPQHMTHSHGTYHNCYQYGMETAYRYARYPCTPGCEEASQQAQVQFLTSYIGHFFQDIKYMPFWHDLVESRLMTNMWYQFCVTWHDFLQQYVCDVKMTSKWLLFKTNFCLRNQICLQQQYNMQKVYQVWDHFHQTKKFEYIYVKGY